MKRILIAGYLGYSNLGDEFLAQCAVAKLKSAGYAVSLLEKENRKPRKLISCILKHDIVFFAGGSLLQDVTGRGFSVLYYAAIAFFAELMGKHVFFVAQGIGPIRRSFSRFVVRHVLTRATYVSVRNNEAAAFLQALNVKKFRSYNDLLFSTSLKTIKTRAKTIAISLRPTAKTYDFQWVLALAKTYRILLVPMQKHVDEQFVKKLRHPNITHVPFDEKQIIHAISSATVAIGMRLHFLVMAALAGVPFIGIAYDPKVSALTKRLQMPVVQPIAMENIPAQLAYYLPRFAHNRGQYIESIARERRVGEAQWQEVLHALASCS